MGAALRVYLGLSRALPFVAPALLRRRAAQGREIPERMAEKLGQPGLPRPEGQLVWLHAVGLGEVLALRGLIAAMAEARPGLEFLVTSTARSSAQVMAANLPPRTRHQFLPLDAPGYVARFLDHWRPDLSVWAEQDLWPGAVVAAARRGIPLAMVNARMSAAGMARRARVRGLFADLLGRFALVAAQDAETAERLAALGARAVRVSGSLKPAAPVLAAEEGALAAAAAAVRGRRVWVAASTHPGDEAEAMAAQAVLWGADRAWLMILAPRYVDRAGEIEAALRARGLPHARRSSGAVPEPGHAVWLADSYGEMGIWYRLADRALIGGGLVAEGVAPVGGHNPWEAVALDAAVLHGPDTRNFAADYAALAAAGAAVTVRPGTLAEALLADPAGRIAAGRGLIASARAGLGPLVADLLDLMGAA